MRNNPECVSMPILKQWSFSSSRICGWGEPWALSETNPSQSLKSGVSLLTWCRTGTGILILPAEKVLQGGFIKPGGEKAAQGRGHHMNSKSFCLSQRFSRDWHEKWPFSKAKLLKTSFFFFVLLNRKAKLGRKEFFGSLDRTPNKLQRAAHSQSSSSKEQMGLRGGEKTLQALSDILATAPRRCSLGTQQIISCHLRLAKITSKSY